jgi:hypothetical protein
MRRAAFFIVTHARWFFKPSPGKSKKTVNKGGRYLQLVSEEVL